MFRRVIGLDRSVMHGLQALRDRLWDEFGITVSHVIFTTSVATATMAIAFQ